MSREATDPPSPKNPILLSVITKFELIFGTITNLLAHRSTLSCLAVRHRLESIRLRRIGTTCARLIMYPDCGRDDCSASKWRLSSPHLYVRHNFTSSDCGEALSIFASSDICHSGLDPESIQISSSP